MATHNPLGQLTKQAQVGDEIEIPGHEGTFVVTEARLAGGGTGHGPHDIYPDGWCVTCAPVVNEEPALDRPFSFYQSGCFTNVIPNVRIVGRFCWQWFRVAKYDEQNLRDLWIAEVTAGRTDFGFAEWRVANPR